MNLADYIAGTARQKGLEVFEVGENLVIAYITTDVSWHFYVDLDGEGECPMAEREKYFRIQSKRDADGMFESIEEHV